jgi:hypothetical protein
VISKSAPILIINASFILIESFITLYCDKYVDKFCFRAGSAFVRFPSLSYANIYKFNIEGVSPGSKFDIFSGSIYSLDILP